MVECREGFGTIDLKRFRKVSKLHLFIPLELLFATSTYPLAVCVSTLDVRTKKPAPENLVKANHRRTDFLLRCVRIFLPLTQQWIPRVVPVGVPVGVSVRVLVCVCLALE